MYTDKELKNEIAKFVNGKINQNIAIEADAVTLAVIATHINDFVRSSDYAAHCIWHTTRKAVGAYLARMHRDEDGDIQQMRLPGFNHVQRAYLVDRDGDSVSIPTYELSHSEMIVIASRMEKEIETKRAHLKEFAELMMQRFGKAA